MIQFVEQLITLAGDDPAQVKAQVANGLAYHLSYDLSGKVKGYVITHAQSGYVINPANPSYEEMPFLKNELQAQYVITELCKLVPDWTGTVEEVSKLFIENRSRLRGVFSEAINLPQTELVKVVHSEQ